ncbi:hypothetical protein Droror1_Dr00012802 [Drosera rotundifolia]
MLGMSDIAYSLFGAKIAFKMLCGLVCALFRVSAVGKRELMGKHFISRMREFWSFMFVLSVLGWEWNFLAGIGDSTTFYSLDISDEKKWIWSIMNWVNRFGLFLY